MIFVKRFGVVICFGLLLLMQLSLAVPQTNTHADKTKSGMKTGKTADKVESQDTEIKVARPGEIQHTVLTNNDFKYPSGHSGLTQTGKKTVEQSTEKKSSTGRLLTSVSNQLRPKSRGATEKKLLKMLNDGEEMKIAFPSKQGKQDYKEKSKEWLETRHDFKQKHHDHSKSEDLVAHPYREGRRSDNAGRLHRRRLDVVELEGSQYADMDRRPRVHYHGRIRPYSREEQVFTQNLNQQTQWDNPHRRQRFMPTRVHHEIHESTFKERVRPLTERQVNEPGYRENKADDRHNKFHPEGTYNTGPSKTSGNSAGYMYGTHFNYAKRMFGSGGFFL